MIMLDKIINRFTALPTGKKVAILLTGIFLCLLWLEDFNQLTY